MLQGGRLEKAGLRGLCLSTAVKETVEINCARGPLYPQSSTTKEVRSAQPPCLRHLADEHRQSKIPWAFCPRRVESLLITCCRKSFLCRYIYFWAEGFGFWKREEAETKKKKRNLTVVWYRVEEIGTALRTLVGNGLPKASLSWKVLRRNLVSSKQISLYLLLFFFSFLPLAHF